MGARQSVEVTKALKWLSVIPWRTVKQAAKKFGVHETTLWRALGKQKSNGGGGRVWRIK